MNSAMIFIAELKAQALLPRNRRLRLGGKRSGYRHQFGSHHGQTGVLSLMFAQQGHFKIVTL
jgi:hypothetical protein